MAAAEETREKATKTKQEKIEQREAIFKLMLMILVGVAILYLGLNLVTGIIGTILYIVGGRLFGAG